jgi:ribosomal protein S24E
MRSNYGSKKRALSYKSIRMSHIEQEEDDQVLVNRIKKKAGSQDMLVLLSAYDDIVKNKVS